MRGCDNTKQTAVLTLNQSDAFGEAHLEMQQASVLSVFSSGVYCTTTRMLSTIAFSYLT